MFSSLSLGRQNKYFSSSNKIITVLRELSQVYTSAFIGTELGKEDERVRGLTSMNQSLPPLLQMCQISSAARGRVGTGGRSPCQCALKRICCLRVCLSLRLCQFLSLWRRLLGSLRAGRFGTVRGDRRPREEVASAPAHQQQRMGPVGQHLQAWRRDGAKNEVRMH